MERFSYGTLGEEQSQAVVEAYQRTRSLLKTSMQEGIFVSFATVGRVIRAAVEQGFLDPSVKQSTGGSREARSRAAAAIEKFPNHSRSEQAAIAGVSESTLFRALSEVQVPAQSGGEEIIAGEIVLDEVFLAESNDF